MSFFNETLKLSVNGACNFNFFVFFVKKRASFFIISGVCSKSSSMDVDPPPPLPQPGLKRSSSAPMISSPDCESNRTTAAVVVDHASSVEPAISPRYVFLLFRIIGLLISKII